MKIGDIQFHVNHTGEALGGVLSSTCNISNITIEIPVLRFIYLFHTGVMSQAENTFMKCLIMRRQLGGYYYILQTRLITRRIVLGQGEE